MRHEAAHAPPLSAGRCLWRMLPVLLLSLSLGCSSSGARHGDECEPRRGMDANKLVICGCVPTRSGGGTVIVEGYGHGSGTMMTMVHYICPRGGGYLKRVLVVNGVVDRVLN